MASNDLQANGTERKDASTSDVVDLTDKDERKSSCTEGKNPTKALKKELREWKETGIKSQVLEDFTTAQIAAALAAFLIKYSMKFIDLFEGMKSCPEEDFTPKFIQGSNFVDADDEDKKYLADSVLNAIKQVTQPNALQSFNTSGDSSD